MPNLSTRVPKYNPPKDITINWDTFRKGLNTLLQDTEIDKAELAQADNIMLVGRGVPTRRWGTKLYYQSANATGSLRGLTGFYKSNSSTELLGLSDDGFLTKKSNASYSTLTGVSWASGPSGAQVYMAQLGDAMYIVNGRREVVKYSNPTLVGFPTLAKPVITGATNLSNATGTTTKSYRISSVGQIGETLASGAFELKNQPDTLGGDAGGSLRLLWTGVSTASGILQGFNIYGRSSGDERFIAGVPAGTTFFDDDGSAVPQEFTFPPTADSTGGPLAKIVIRYQDRLVYAGLDGQPAKVLISGKYPNHEKFDLANGGNSISIEPDAGDNIVQLVGFADRIVVLKQRSIWQITLTTEQVSGTGYFITIPTLKLISATNGCIAPASVWTVNNDIYYLARNGVRVLGYQANYLADALRTNELSIKIRPYFDNLTIAQKENAVGIFYNNKYLLAFPGKDEMLIFDTERAAWIGPWSLDSTVFEVFVDESNEEHLLFAQEGTTNVDEFSGSYSDDKGSAIETTLKTRNEDFGDWSSFKNVKDLFTQLRNVVGTVSVDVKLEERTGSITTAKSFNITAAAGNSGWGADQWGNFQWGDSEEDAGGVEAVFTIRWATLNKPARLMSLTYKTTDIRATYELLGIKALAKPLSKGFSPSSWKL